MADPARSVEAIRAAFAAAVATDPIDLGRAALLIGAEAEPDTDVERWLAHLDLLGLAAAGHVQGLGAAEQVRALCRFLHEDHGLRGNREVYDDPRNSYLHRVLERGLGIPITLAVVLIEVGRRAGVPLLGVSFPGHFLVRHAEAALLFDPFDAGRPLTVDDCRALLARVSGGAAPFDPELLRPASSREVVARMLRNLKRIHLREGELGAALADVERLLLVSPGDADERRDRGLVLAGLRRWGAAAQDLARYLAARPTAPDADRVRVQLEEARRRHWELN